MFLCRHVLSYVARTKEEQHESINKFEMAFIDEVEKQNELLMELQHFQQDYDVPPENQGTSNWTRAWIYISKYNLFKLGLTRCQAFIKSKVPLLYLELFLLTKKLKLSCRMTAGEVWRVPDNSVASFQNPKGYRK